MAVLEHLIKPIYSLMNKSKNNAEMHEDSIFWRDFLFGIVPVERLSQSLRHAIKKQTGSFAPNFFDVKNAWLEIAAKEHEAAKEQELKNNPAAACPGAKYHVGFDVFAQIILMNPHTQLDELYPCPKCRILDFENKKKTDIALYGEIKPMIILEKMVEAHAPKVEVEIIPLEEIAALELEHNSIVRQIAGDAANGLLIVWDEGANCFARANYRSRTFSAEIVRKAIEDYRRILEKKL